MTRYLLDTNVISDTIKPQPQTKVVSWLAIQDVGKLYFSAVGLGEIKRGIVDLPVGRRRQELEQWYSGSQGPRAWFGDRILPFDEASAEQWAEIIAEGRRKGSPRGTIDMMIAATAAANDCIVVTLNERDFTGLVPVFNLSLLSNTYGSGSAADPSALT